MKKTVFFSLLAATMLLATACTKDEPTTDNNGFVRVSLRAPQVVNDLGEGLATDSLVWAVYTKIGEDLQEVKTLGGSQGKAFTADTDGRLTAQVPLQLAKGQTYYVAFWAQNSACTAYNTDDLLNIHYAEGVTLIANDETRDAFFGCDTIVVDQDATPEVILKRPFAQLNFAVSQEEIDAAAAAGIELVQSYVAISEMATGFNALTGAVTADTTNVVFALDSLPGSTITTTLEGVDTTFVNLSMHYILANDITAAGNQSVTADVTFKIATLYNTTDPKSPADTIEIVSANTPLQRNYRTNVIGSLTNTADFKVVVDATFENDYNNYMIETVGADLSDAVDAAKDADVDEIVFTDDVNGAATESGYNGKAGIQHTNGATIDGRGQTLTVTGANGTWDCAIYTQGGIIKNLNIEGAFRGISFSYAPAKVIVDNVTITPGCYTIHADAGNGHGLEVKNCTLNGWTSFGANIGEVTFDKTHFGSNGSHAYFRPYSPTTLTNCTFSEGFEMDARQTTGIVLKNCKVGETLITQENIATLLGADAAQATVEND